jgi:hypothetical protein
MGKKLKITNENSQNMKNSVNSEWRITVPGAVTVHIFIIVRTGNVA